MQNFLNTQGLTARKFIVYACFMHFCYKTPTLDITKTTFSKFMTSHIEDVLSSGNLSFAMG